MGMSAQVFLADDVKLRRRVAVKLLHAALADDQAFLRRFGSEVRAAAAMRHPHVAAIHDWSEGDEPYLVTEFLGGGSLRALLDRGGRLTPSQALQVGLAAARGLDYAHGRGLVHRGLKPSNLLFGDDGRLRIADFGLARALAEAASTEPQGAVLGTARYSAPEQVQGHSIDGRADVYALALILIEAVTGKVPFSADTTIATLMARVDVPLPVPDDLGALAAPLTRAGAPQRDDRLDAAGLVTSLMSVAGSLPAPDPLPLAGTLDEQGDVASSDSTRIVLPAAPSSGADIDDITYFGQAPDVDDAPVIDALAPRLNPSTDVGRPRDDAEAASTDVGGSGDGSASVRVQPRRPTPAQPEADSEQTEDVSAKHPRRAKFAWIVLAVLLVVGLVGGGAVALLASRAPKHRVPSLGGVDQAVALGQLRRLGFDPKVETRRQDGTAAGQVLGTRPEAGTNLAEGRTIVVVVSGGPTLVKLPTDLAGQPQAQAEATLKGLGLFLHPAQVDWSETIAAGSVIGYAPGTGAEVPKGQAVTIVVSQGPQPRTVPEAAGLTVDEAKAALTQLGLVPSVVEVFSDTVDKGDFVGFSPGSGQQAARGSTVEVQVSKGPEMVTVPSLGGVRTIDEAVQILASAGLQAGNAQGRLSGRPRAFDPPSGSLVRKGSSVDIILR